MGDRRQHQYLIALGSNMRHHRFGEPARVVEAAADAMSGEGFAITRMSKIIASTPIGPSSRRFANAAMVARSRLAPIEALAALKGIEDNFGRKTWRRWGARVLDLDIVMWNGGNFASDRLTIPHPEFRNRGFVVGPAAAIAPEWSDPITGLTLRQLHRRLTRPVPLPS